MRKRKTRMKSRRALIRLQKWHVDEIRRRMAELEAMRREFEDKRKELEASLADERQFGERSPLGAYAYPSFARATSERRLKLDQSIQNIDRELEATKETLAEAYRELKKIELLEEGRVQRAKQAEARREQSELDEIALEAHHRQQAN